MKVNRQIFALLTCLVLGLVSTSGLAKTHLVKSGETFYRISKIHGVDVDQLMVHNGFKDPSTLRAGQTIKIPGKSVRVATKAVYVKPKPVAPKALRIILDPGHGGKDRGAVRGRVHEADLNLKVALQLERRLKSLGYRVVMTRRSDVFVSLESRARIANRYSNAIFVSIHFNASDHTGVRGAETFYVSDRGCYLARGVQSRMVGNLKLRNRGYKYKRFSVLRHTGCPAILVECGFISNSYERSRCVTSSYQSSAARAILSGIQQYDRKY
jgi:N-acetylmuramoyl-L-alanine amidase